MKKLNINESFICRIWEGGKKYYSDLKTSSGETVEVIELGKRNFDAGPDYSDAKLRIGDKIFSGDVEIHREFEGWEQHKHHRDRKYNSVILQVVLWDSEKRTAAKPRNKRDIPTVILSEFLNQSIHSVWRDIISNPAKSTRLPCSETNHIVPDEEIKNLLGELSIERLHLKMNRFSSRLDEIEKERKGYIVSANYLKSRANWEQIFYEFTFEALGYSKNKEQMMKLAKSVSLSKAKNLLKNSNSEMTGLQAVLYGAGGFLFDVRYKSEYITFIKEYWNNIKEKHKLTLMQRSEWQFFGMRPQNYPPVRIAYGSQLIIKILKEDLFKNIVLIFENKNFKTENVLSNLQKLFEPFKDRYWTTHYDLGKECKITNKLLGRQRLNEIISNVLVPLIYYYSRVFNKANIKENVLAFNNTIKSGSINSITELIKREVIRDRKISLDNSANEQGAIQLYNFYCTRGKCESCSIGKNLVREKSFEYKIIFY